MTIKNKDGTLYKLRGPNPTMKEQDLWDKDKYILHNLKGLREIALDTTEVNPIESDFNAPQPVVQVSVVVTPAKEEKDEVREAANIFHCLPAVVRKHRDTLYNESYSSVKYDRPFTFEALIVENTDLTLQFWTSAVAADKITEGSVVYPKIMEKRWWKITNRSLSWSGGWLMTAVPSDFQPAFTA